MGQEQVPVAISLLLSGCGDSSGLTIWDIERGAELEWREMGEAFLFSSWKLLWCLQKHGMPPQSLRPMLAAGAGVPLSRLCPHQQGQHR